MSNYDLNSRVIDLTLGELLNAVEEKVKAILPGSLQKQPQDKNFVYGLKGLAKLLGCSKPQPPALRLPANTTRQLRK